MRTTSSRPGIGKIIFNYGELAEQLGINGQIIGVHDRAWNAVEVTVESKQIPATIPTRARTLLGASLQRVMPRLPTPKVEPEVSDAKLTAALGSTLRQYGHLLFERNIAAFASHLNDFLHEEEDDEDDDTD